MKRVLLIPVLIFLFIPFFSKCANKEQGTYSYLIYLPKDHKVKKYPLVIYLHGSSQRGNELSKLKQYGLPQAMESGQEFDFIIVAPQCPAGMLWSSENWFDPLYEELLRTYEIDTDRIYLTGVSMGGGGVFDVAKDRPNVFAALVPLCAWASTTDRICNLRNIPIWTFHGTQDEVVPISQTESKVNALMACNGMVKFTRLANQGHSIHWIYESREYAVFDWMLKQRRKNKNE